MIYFTKFGWHFLNSYNIYSSVHEESLLLVSISVWELDELSSGKQQMSSITRLCIRRHRLRCVKSNVLQQSTQYQLLASV